MNEMKEKGKPEFLAGAGNAEAVIALLRPVVEFVEKEKREAGAWARQLRLAIAKTGEERWKLLSDLDLLLKAYKRIVKIRTDAMRTAIESIEKGR